MVRIIKKLFGLDLILKEQEKTNKLLSDLIREMKRNSDLVEKYNNAYHIK